MGRANMIAKWEETTFQALKDTGCMQLAFGVESGSQRILELISKKISPDMVIEATRRLVSHGIGAKGFFIFGFPTETTEELQMTVDLALEMARNGSTEMAAFEFHPYPGSALWLYLKRHNPDVLTQLDYIEYLDPQGLLGRAADRAAKTSGWLPEHVQIAEVPSSEVRKFVMQTLQKFYEIVNL